MVHGINGVYDQVQLGLGLGWDWVSGPVWLGF